MADFDANFGRNQPKTDGIRLITITRQMVAFNGDSDYRLDMEAFEASVNSASAESPEKRLRDAVELYRGDFLEGFYVRNAPEFEVWVLAQLMLLLALGGRRSAALLPCPSQICPIFLKRRRRPRPIARRRNRAGPPRPIAH